MYKLEFTLKQHTPIIHFQPEQDGATLRATEVKPKLDRFIIEKLEGFDKVKSDHPDWLVGNGVHPSLNYKIKFLNSQFYQSTKEIINSKKILLLFTEEVQGNIICLVPNLKDFIKENLFNFFLINNFGFRQSKGYGSFTLSTLDNIDVNQIDINTKIKLLNKNVFFKRIVENQINIWELNLKCINKPRNLRKNSKEENDYYNKLKELRKLKLLSSPLFSHIYLMNIRFDVAKFNNIRDILNTGNNEIVSKMSVYGIDYINNLKFKLNSFINDLPFIFFNNEIHDRIDIDWRYLKSGLQHGGYKKSLLFKYMCKQGYRWEKRKIKQEIERLKLSGNPDINLSLQGNLNRMVDCLFDEGICSDNMSSNFSSDDFKSESQTFAYVRALLGLAEHYEFLVDGSRDIKYQVSIHSNQEEIERFQSPVIFKIIDQTIYALPQKMILPLDSNNTFDFKIQKKHVKNGNIGGVHDLINNLPIPSNFNLMDFLTLYLPCIGFIKILSHE